MDKTIIIVVQTQKLEEHGRSVSQLPLIYRIPVGLVANEMLRRV